MTAPAKKLPIATLERIDEVCNQFENAWQAGQRPTIETWLEQAQDDDERKALLRELLALDMDYRVRAGECVEAADYFERFRQDEGVVAKLFDELSTQGTATHFAAPSLERMSQLFPGLDILGLVGTGGMGAVYKARQKGLDRVVAIKVLPDEIGHEAKFALRFTREARVLARLNHPNIVSVYEFGDADGTYYFLMEFVDGSTLRDVIRTGELRPDQALAIVPSLCDALQYAHDKGVVHRDIKPENILIDRSGIVKIADFGLSQLIGIDHPELSLTATHQVMGTLRYMAPEQMEGAHQVDHRADIYSLGVVFYEMLTGELPIGRFAVPSEKVQIDVRLDEVVLRTLEKEPQRRYQRASQVKSDLESIASSSALPLRNSSPPTPESATERRDKGQQPGIAEQELSARTLVLRRQLMSNVESAMRPLWLGQFFQMAWGIALIALGVYGWTPNIDVPIKLVSGIVLHAFGVVNLIAGGYLCWRIKAIDYTQSISAVKKELDDILRFYSFGGMALGFPWWIMWIPVVVIVGFEEMTPRSLFPIAIACFMGLLATLPLAIAIIRRDSRSSTKPSRLAGTSLRKAYACLQEMSAQGLE